MEFYILHSQHRNLLYITCVCVRARYDSFLKCNSLAAGVHCPVPVRLHFPLHESGEGRDAYAPIEQFNRTMCVV